MENKLVDYIRSAVDSDDEPLQTLLAVTETGYPAFADVLKHPERPNVGKYAVESALKIVLSELIKDAISNESLVMRYQRPGRNAAAVPRLLDLTLAIFDAQDGKDGRKNPNASIFVMLEDVLEGVTVEEFGEIFAYFEKKKKLWEEVWAAAWEGQGGAKLGLLRFCNQLMRRLPRGLYVDLTGRILMFLARLFLLSDKSGLNQQGHINTNHPVQVAEEKGAVDHANEPIDHQLYTTLWGLQRTFQDPHSALEPATWSKVAADIKRVLAELKKHPATVSAGPLTSAQGDGGATTVAFLSSPKLLRLQLQDATLRRIWLIQCLILFGSCRNPPKGKPRLMSKPESEMKELESLVYRELAKTPDGGSHVAEAVRAALQREEGHIKWKLEGCASLKRPPVPLLKAGPPPRHSRLVKKGQLDLGNPDLTRLWNLARKEESGAPTSPEEELRKFLQPVITEMDPDEALEEQYKTKKDPLYFWKAGRLLSRIDLTKYCDMLQLGKGEPDLEIAVKALYPHLFPELAQEEPTAATTSGLGGDTDMAPEPNQADTAAAAGPSSVPPETAPGETADVDGGGPVDAAQEPVPMDIDNPALPDQATPSLQAPQDAPPDQAPAPPAPTKDEQSAGPSGAPAPPPGPVREPSADAVPSGAPDSAAPDSAAPNSAAPDSAAPNSAAPDSAAPDSTAPAAGASREASGARESDGALQAAEMERQNGDSASGAPAAKQLDGVKAPDPDSSPPRRTGRQETWPGTWRVQNPLGSPWEANAGAGKKDEAAPAAAKEKRVKVDAAAAASNGEAGDEVQTARGGRARREPSKAAAPVAEEQAKSSKRKRETAASSDGAREPNAKVAERGAPGTDGSAVAEKGSRALKNGEAKGGRQGRDPKTEGDPGPAASRGGRSRRLPKAGVENGNGAGGGGGRSRRG